MEYNKVNKTENVEKEKLNIEKVTTDGLLYQISYNKEKGEKYIRINGIIKEMDILHIPKQIENINVEIIKKGAFEDNNKIKEVYMPETIRLLGANAFKNCIALEKVQLPAKLRVVNQNCFNGCLKLKDVEFPNSIIRICSNAFHNCVTLSKVRIDNNGVDIANDAFDDKVKIACYSGFASYIKYLFGKNSSKNLKHNVAKEKYIEQLMERTGWNRKKAIKSLDDAAILGISNNIYLSKYVFQLNEEEQKEFAKLRKQLRQKNKEDNAFYISEVCRKSGWNEEKAVAEMNKAKEMGVSYLKYVQKEFWARNNKARVAKLVQKDKKRISNDKEMYIEKICNKTGWSIGKTELEVMRAKINCGCSYEDFLVYRFYEKTPEEQKKYVTLGQFQKMRIKYNNYLTSQKIFDDKAAFNETFAEYINHKWFINRDISYNEFLANIEGLDKVIVKPLTATQGKGINVYLCNVSEEENKRIYDEIMSLNKSIVEEYIVQNDEIAKFNSTSVNTVRVMTLNYNNECRLLHSVFRMGNGGVVDNFHAGGVAADVNVKTGIVSTNAADLDGNVFDKSPATGITIKGFQIPYWDEIIETCKKITGKVEGADLIGWDFAITQKGVDLIEGNPGASYIVAQIPNVEDNKGLVDAMVTPYL